MLTRNLFLVEGKFIKFSQRNELSVKKVFLKISVTLRNVILHMVKKKKFELSIFLCYFFCNLAKYE